MSSPAPALDTSRPEMPSPQRPGLVSPVVQLHRFAQALSLTTGVLILATYPLWFDRGTFPQVPLLSAGGSTPTWLEDLATVTVLISLVWVLLQPQLPWQIGSAKSPTPDPAALSGERLADPYALLMPDFRWLIVAAGLLLLGITNQHRLQPWAYFCWLAAVVQWGIPHEQRLKWLRALMVSVYLYSALTKLDVTFMRGLGDQLLTAAVGIVGLDATRWSPSVRQALVLGLPLGELLVGVLLARRSTRFAGVVLGTLLHLVLLTLLSPWQLNHRPPVMLWNFGFALQLWALFGPPTPHVSSLTVRSVAGPLSTAFAPAPDGRLSPVRFACGWLARSVVFAALVLPLADSWGGWDHWLSWGLYSPRSSRAELWIATESAADLPADLQSWLAPPTAEDEDWRRLRLDHWSFQSLGVPLYPQDRFQLGVIAGVLGPVDGPLEFQVHHLEMAERLTGRREAQRISTRAELQERLKPFWLNATPSGEWTAHPRRP